MRRHVLAGRHDQHLHVDVTAGAVGNALDLVGNLRHVPGAMVSGVEGELVQVPSAEAMRAEFSSSEALRPGRPGRHDRPRAAPALLSGTLAGVLARTVDAATACLPAAFVYSITSDGPATLRLAAGRNEGTLHPLADHGIVSRLLSVAGVSPLHDQR